MRNNKYKTALNWILPVVVVLAILTGGIFETAFVLIGYLIYRFYTERDKINSYYAKRNYLKGRLKKSVERYEKAYNTKVAENKVIISYVYSLILTGDYEKANHIMGYIRELSKKEDIEVPVLICEAFLKWKIGKNLRAALVTLESMHNDLKNSSYYANLGRLYILSGQMDKAKRLNDEAYEYNKNNSLVLENMLYCQYMDNEYEKAMETVKQLICSNPHTPDAFYYSGLVYEKNNKSEKAHKLYRRALKYEHSTISLSNHDDINMKLQGG